MSSFSLVISPRDRSRARFTENTYACAIASLLERSFLRRDIEAIKEAKCYVTLRSATSAYALLGFGSWLEPRYIFAARHLI